MTNPNITNTKPQLPFVPSVSIINVKVHFYTSYFLKGKLAEF